MGASMKYVGYYLPSGALRPHIYTYIYIYKELICLQSFMFTHVLYAFHLPVRSISCTIATPSIRGLAHRAYRRQQRRPWELLEGDEAIIWRPGQTQGSQG